MGNESYAKITKRFLKSRKWQNVRIKVFDQFGYRCLCCGKSEKALHIDHIVPRACINRSMWLDMSNLQVLCEKCNIAKGTQTIDYRSNYDASKHVYAGNLNSPIKKKTKNQRRTERKLKKRMSSPDYGYVTLPSGKKLPLYVEKHNVV